MYFKEKDGSWEFHSIWREDEDGNIYCKSGVNEVKIYCFNINEGEVYAGEGGDCPMIIDSIRINEFGTESRRFFYGHSECIPDYIFKWIEGVGSLCDPHINDDYFLVGGNLLWGRWK